ncbi:hypothetical protein J4437_03225 [Candidatus Woesearchaeota archaeon]|nr:hypothetical protein [Candidatus Woesearchaeota archaeon]
MNTQKYGEKGTTSSVNEVSRMSEASRVNNAGELNNSPANRAGAIISNSSKERHGNMPERKFRAGAISATIWLNKGQSKNGLETEYKTVSLERCYTDKEGKWQNTTTMRVNDLPRASVALQKAYEYLVLQEQELFKENY